MKKYFILLTLFYTLHPHQERVHQVVEKTKSEHINFVEYAFVDFIGTRKSITKSAASLQADLINGINFDGSSILGGNTITNSDMHLKPDLDTVTRLPWTSGQNSTMRIICDMYQDEHTPYQSDPRVLLKTALKRAHEYGYDFIVGPELEFFILKNGQPYDGLSYFDVPQTVEGETLKAELLTLFDRLGIAAEKWHHEVAPGQFEISLEAGTALAIADQIITAKHALSTLLKSAGLHVSFMPKPFTDHNGTGMHINFSLYDIKREVNAFYDANHPHKLSAIGQAFIAGVLHYAQEITLLLNPTVNSYKRLVPGFEAPIYICAGARNRSALVRIPRINEHQSGAVRGEIRSPDPMCNPYLAFALLLHAGLDGIDNNLTLNELVEDNLYHLSATDIAQRDIALLPMSLQQAITCCTHSEFCTRILGQQLHSDIIAYKQQEVREFNCAVTDWELTRYQ